MKRSFKLSISFFVLLVLSFIFLQTNLQAQKLPAYQPNGNLLIENFENEEGGELPSGWYDRDGNKKLVNHTKEFLQGYNYRVREEDGNKFLHYEGSSAKHISFPLINKEKENIYNINLYETPVLRWKVRAHSLPENANEDVNERNDAVASIYVAFDMGRIALFKKVPKTIRYTWSTTLQKGTRTSKLFGNQNIIVVKSGREDMGEWVTFERNIVEDYRMVFGDDPPKTPLALIILSDGDSTGSYAEADYDDIMLKPADRQSTN